MKQFLQSSELFIKGQNLNVTTIGAASLLTRGVMYGAELIFFVLRPGHNPEGR